MQLNHFFLLPIVTGMLTLSFPYTLPAAYAPSLDEIPVEIVTEVEVPTEANPIETPEAREEVVEDEVQPVKQPVPVDNTQGVIESNGAVLRSELVPICRCESGLRQYNDDGTVLRGRVNPLDVGICQVNLKYHEAAADRMGYDLLTLEGNIRYSNYLYSTQGAQPWGWSASCHGQY